MTKKNKQLIELFLDSNITAGGLYGLTVDDEFRKELFEIIDSLSDSEKRDKIKRKIERKIEKEYNLYKEDLF